MSGVLLFLEVLSGGIGCIFCILCLLATFRIYDPMNSVIIPCLICSSLGILSGAIRAARTGKVEEYKV